MEEFRRTACKNPAEEMTKAVEALTGLARKSRQTGADGFARADVAEEIAHVLVQVAANMGGSLDALLGGTPASRYAGQVAQLITTHTSGPQIMSRRTAPVLLHLDIVETFATAGITDKFTSARSAVRIELERTTDRRKAEELHEVAARLHGLYAADRHRYVTAYEAAATRAARGEGIAETVDVEVIPTGPGVPDRDAPWDDLAATLHVAAAIACEDVVREILAGESYDARAWRDVTGSAAGARAVNAR